MTQNAEIFMIISNYFSGEITAKEQQTLRMVETAEKNEVFKDLAKRITFILLNPILGLKNYQKDQMSLP